MGFSISKNSHIKGRFNLCGTMDHLYCISMPNWPSQMKCSFKSWHGTCWMGKVGSHVFDVSPKLAAVLLCVCSVATRAVLQVKLWPILTQHVSYPAKWKLTGRRAHYVLCHCVSHTSPGPAHRITAIVTNMAVARSDTSSPRRTGTTLPDSSWL